MNLIASNLLAIFVLTGLPIIKISDVTSLSYTTTPSFCAISEGAIAFVTTSSILSVLLIGLDQYLAVVDPLRYRTRIDKLKCGLLILALWIISLVFGILASLNPQPQSLCYHRDVDDNSYDTTSETKLRFQASVVVNGNATENADLEIEGEISFQNNGNDVYNASLAILGNNNTGSVDYSNVGMTYGLVYALTYAVLGYLVPFLAICWIYISIYTAARSNSERTRRNGSRPVLSSGSFSEEASINGYNHKPDTSFEDFRRIPKISSLSSIDENSETCPSQIMSAPHVPYENGVEEEDDAQEAAENGNPAVVFMVGSTKVEADQSKNNNSNNELNDSDNVDDAKESTKSKVPISTLKAKFLLSSNVNRQERSVTVRRDSLDLVKSRFPDVPEHRRKSSHDLMYEEMMLGCGKHPYEYDDDDLDSSSDEEDDNEDDDDDEVPEKHDYEEAQPLSPVEVFVHTNNVDNTHSSSRSISVNFDLNENNQDNVNSKMLGSNSENNQNEANHQSTPSHSLPIVTITPPGQKTITPAPPLHRVPSIKSTHSYINNLKYKISNGSLFKYREETRAARISALVIVMGLICWTPYIYILVTRNLPSSYESQKDFTSTLSRPTLDTTALGFLILATYISPLLFGYRSRRVKRELRKFFCFKRELSYKNNRSLMAKKVLRRRHSGATILSQFVGESNSVEHSRYNIFNCMYGRNRWPKEKVQFVQVPETALAVETCRSSFSSGASTQISSTSTDEC